MFQDDMLFALSSFAVAAVLFFMWLGDYKYFRKHGVPRKGGFEGATPAPLSTVLFGCVFALVLLASHVALEVSLGVEIDQSSVQWWAIFSWVGAAFVEELIFRGYLVVKNRGNFMLVLSVIVFSIVFAAGHPFVWNYEVADGKSVFDGVWTFNPTIQSVLSTIAIFECSLLFYFMRFMPSRGAGRSGISFAGNPYRSLIPSVAAHFTYNAGVFLVKLFEGYVE